MPNPVTPSRAKSLIPATTGSRCERLAKLFQLPSLFSEDVSYKYNEDGSITTAFKNDLCALGCLGGGGNGGGPPPNPNMPAPLNVMATDDAYSDKIRVTWDAVTPPTGVAAVTEYNIYRSGAENLDPSNASLIGTVTAPTLLFDDPVDADLVVGTNYIYWVTATNGTDTSAFSIPNAGRAAAPTTDLPAISDLKATQGFQLLDGGPIGLVWTPPAGASKYDIYRNTTNDFSTATKIQSDMVPQNTADHTISTQSPDSMWDNVGEILFWHFPPSNTTHYFFFVVAKRTSPSSISVESNAAEGWARSFYAPYLDPAGAFKLDRGSPSATEGVDFNGNQIRVVLFGGGGGGAGGSQIWGGGAGGGGAVVIEEFNLAPGDILTVEYDPDVDETGNAPAATDADDGSDTIFKINGVEVMRAGGGDRGQFSASGAGIGGDGGIGSGGAPVAIYDGRPGLPGAGANGGRAGYSFGNKRYPGAHYNGYSGGGYDGNGAASIGGGGSYAAPGFEVLAVGGKGSSGYAVIVASG